MTTTELWHIRLRAVGHFGRVQVSPHDRNHTIHTNAVRRVVGAHGITMAGHRLAASESVLWLAEREDTIGPDCDDILVRPVPGEVPWEGNIQPAIVTSPRVLPTARPVARPDEGAHLTPNLCKIYKPSHSHDTRVYLCMLVGSCVRSHILRCDTNAWRRNACVGHILFHRACTL
jgi:hypothetical protein